MCVSTRLGELDVPQHSGPKTKPKRTLTRHKIDFITLKGKHNKLMNNTMPYSKILLDNDNIKYNEVY